MSEQVISTINDFITSQEIDKNQPNWKTRLPIPHTATFDSENIYHWQLNTSCGDIRIKLLPEVAPMHVTSTIYLTLLGFYDDLNFHRVITRFMAQGGCPLGTGTGGPGYQYAGEFDPSVKHDRPGLLSMANAGPGTDGSQFFLTFVETPWLDGAHTIFGEIVDGFDSLEQLESYGSQSGQTTADAGLLLEKASIEVNKT